MKKKKVVQKNSYKDKKRLLILSLISAITLLLSSAIFTSLGDKLLLEDNFSDALNWYHAAIITNPLNRIAQKNLFIANTSQTIRLEEGKELEKTSHQVSYNTNSRVLGTTANIPVLMYHYIRINPDPNDKIGFNLSVTPYDFAKQMDYLVSRGYHAITLDELGSTLFRGLPLPSKPIIITFDDGYVDSYTNAYPILRSHGLKGVDFIITGFVGAPRYLTWGEIEEMERSGVFTFGAHTVHHYSLPSLSINTLMTELTESKHTLSSHVGYNINWLAYPYGQFNDQVITATQKAGYLGAFSTLPGTYQSTDKLFTLPRIRVGGGMGVSSLAARLQ